MGNKSRRRARVTNPSVKPPPRAPNWIYTGRDRGYDFINMDRIEYARADFDDGQVRIRFSDLSEDGYFDTFKGRPAEDLIAHLFMVGIDVTGAAEVLRARCSGVRESLQSLYVLEDEQLERFHRGEIAIEDDGAEHEDAGADLCETCDAGRGCPDYRAGRTGTCEGHIARELENEGEGSCVICGCTESTPCTGNDGNPCCDDKEECDDCNDCGDVLPVNCHECEHADKPSCTWSNAGPAPCPGFERDPAGTKHLDGCFLRIESFPEEVSKAIDVIAGAADIGGTSADRANCWYGEECHRFPRCLGCSLRNLRDRTSPASPADVLEVTGKTTEELIDRVRTCVVFRGLQQRGALFGKDYCNVGHEMKEPACACCEYLRISSSEAR